ncbi:MAG: isoamylase early set domain-containing protein [Bacteroidales bacterium]|nr:isoamylase early set domain-containing protein [Bacteroidales bacterium]MBK9358215.1 isoamylase early set domain-containing protein [Bacteroidales bacterium]
MSIKKQFLKSKPVCKVSFKLTKDQVNNAGKVNIVGDFNQWNETSDELKPLKDGSFSQTFELESGREYQFRYLVDGTTWMNDEEADRYVNSGLGDSHNAVISL